MSSFSRTSIWDVGDARGASITLDEDDYRRLELPEWSGRFGGGSLVEVLLLVLMGVGVRCCAALS